MSALCPNGHRSGSGDFCDVCGEPIADESVATQPWEAVVWADRAYFDSFDHDDEAFPESLRPRRFLLELPEVLVGRRHRTLQGITPHIDLSGHVEDGGISHLHASFVRQPDGSLAVVDLRSRNGTTINDSRDPLVPNSPVQLVDGDHVHVGSWTTITLRSIAPHHAGTSRPAVDGTRAQAPGTVADPRVWLLCADADDDDVVTTASASSDKESAVQRVVDRCLPHRGHVLTESDGRCVVAFPTPDDLLAAVGDIQSVDPDGSLPLWRVGIDRERMLGGARGMTPATSAGVIAVCLAGHPGQVLVSEQAAEDVRRLLPEGAELTDLGVHRLIDLDAPRRLVQIDLTGSHREYPPVASLDALPNNLPSQVTRFIGRRLELARLLDLLAYNRLCTVTGPGGVGKTRLTLQAGGRLLPRFPDGVWVADLSGISEPGLVGDAIAAALGVREAGSATVAAPDAAPARRPVDRIADYLQDHQALVVINDCEQVIDACAELIGPLLARCPRIRVLVTSREALHLRGEAVLKLGPLGLPGPSHDPAAAREAESVRLFIDRALMQDPGLPLDGDALQLMGMICARVDGIPFGIELAAARTGALSLEQIEASLEDRLRFLSTDDRVSRQPTLWSLIEWSHALLSELERTLLRRLAVFAGGFTVEAVTEICSGDGVERFDVVGLLTGLVDKSLVEVEAASDGKRFRLLEMTRDFALEQLVDAGELVMVDSAHRAWYLAFAERADHGIAGPDQLTWLDAMEAEYENLRHALVTGRDSGGRDDLRLAAALGHYMLVRGLLSDGAALLDDALLNNPTPRDSLLAKGLCSRALIACFAGELERAEQAATEASEVAESVGVATWIACGLTIRGLALASRGELRGAEELHRAALARVQGPEPFVRSLSLANLGNVLAMRGAAREASEHYAQSLAIRRRQGDLWGLAWTCYRMGSLAGWRGDVVGALELLDESLDRANAIGFRQGALLASLGLAETRLAMGELDAAEGHLLTALRVAREIEDVAGACLALAGLADVFVARGEVAGAASWLTEDEASSAERSPASLAAVKRSRAALAAARGDLVGSEALHQDVLRLRRQLGDARGMLDELEELALLAGQQMRLVDAASLLGSLQLGRAETGFAVPGARRAAVDALAVRVAGAPDPAVPVAFTTGTQIGLADAVGAALGEAGTPVADTVVTVTRAAHDQDVLTHARDAWYDALRGRLTAQHGDDAGMTLCGRYSGAFPTAYWTTRSTDEAALDIARIEARGDGLVASLRRVPSTGDLFQLHLIDVDKVALADALPILEHMGLRVLDEHPYAIERTGAPVWFYDITLTCHGTLAADEALALERFEQAFVRVWTASLEDDGFNQLVLSAALSAHDVTILRAYARYLRQTGNAFSLAHIERAVSSHPDVAQALVDLFRARFDPDGPPADDEGQLALAQVVTSAIDAVKALDEDRILRSMLRLVQATQRTTAYLPRADGGVLVGFKLATGSLPELAKPRPMFEIFVYSPWMEGVHLRGGRVARGGIRWSERDDYRTEVHGLMKAQSVKNAVIVPVGAKGGFVVRRPARDAKDAPAEVRRCYADFIGCLLDLTDNVVRGEVQPPPMVRYDEDDPYLVVAADKGTATFSDQANAISAEHGFWLGDAFASGGRAGYDHKALAITARGAWESVRRHFWRVGVDPERDDITVVAIGDMSGDVCGNGLLRSSRIRLVGAFDHRHVFLDPDPDADASFIERQRLFKLERSSWDDFDRDLLSPGGGVFPRDAKSISLSPQCRALLDVAEETLTPDEVIRAMLKASVDLLWNGGIGTFVKSSAESDADAGDRSSDAIRVDAADLRCRVVGEGGNLGFTQLARVEYASGGGLINTDAIDNSAGVDCSDHEVNIKILLDQAIVAGALPPSEREELLAAMAGDVCSSVLLNNTLQADALARYVTDADVSGRMHLLLMQDLERSGHIDRAVERLPGDKEMEDRIGRGRGLTTSELAVLLATTKLALRSDILASDLPDEPFLADELRAYFPPVLRERFAAQIATHPLRREIVASLVANEVLNREDICYVFRSGDRAGVRGREVVCAYLVARDLLGMRDLWHGLDDVGRAIPARVRVDMLQRWNTVIEWLTDRLMRSGDGIDVVATVARYADPVSALIEALPDTLVPADRETYDQDVVDLESHGVPAGLASRAAGAPYLMAVLDIADLSLTTGRDALDVAHQYAELAHLTNMGWLRDQLRALPGASHWEAMARTVLQEDLYDVQRRATGALLASSGVTGPEDVVRWLEETATPMQRPVLLVGELRGTGADAATLGLALRELKGGVDALSPTASTGRDR